MLVTEKRTQLYLPIDLYHAALGAAREKGLSLAALVRKALEAYLRDATRTKADWTTDPLNQAAGFITEGPHDLSETIDDTLYHE